MDYTRWLIRAKRWAQNPPSARRVITILAVIAACIAIAAIEWFGLWPQGLSVNKLRP